MAYKVTYMTRDNKSHLVESKRIKFNCFIDAVKYARKLRAGHVDGHTLIGYVTIEEKQ